MTRTYSEAPDDDSEPESYPTFWDAIPVDSVGLAPHTDTTSDPEVDAYTALFIHSDAGSGTLHVEQSDVGLN